MIVDGGEGDEGGTDGKINGIREGSSGENGR